MTQPYDDVPPLVDQPMPNGTWVATLNAFMVWMPRGGDISVPPQGPLEEQVHDSGLWSPGSGGSMTWIPADREFDQNPVIPIVYDPGDEEQPGDNEDEPQDA